MLQRLQRVLDPEVVAQLAPRWEAFRRRSPQAGATTFLGRLHGEGVIDAGQLKEALGALEVDLDAGPDTFEGERYEIVGVLGRGAMGEVSIALDRRLNRSVAVKRMDLAIASQRELARRFFTEAQITAQLDHPGIIPVYSFEVRADGTREYGMKLIRGKTLEDVIGEVRACHDERRPLGEDLDLASRLDLFVQVCNALHYAHSRGVLHRDLKPENVMVGPFHEVIVMDWGIAKVIGAREEITPEMAGAKGTATQVGMIIGTPLYMSPEQAEGKNDELDARSDQYSLGLILYELIALRPAREGRTSWEVVTIAQEGEIRPLKPYHPSAPVPPGLSAIVRKATALEPGDRYRDVQALAADVRRFLRDEEVLARPDNALQKAQRWVSHHRGTTLAVVFGLILSIIVLGVLGVGGAAAALEVSRRAAAEREARMMEALEAVTGQAHRIDTRLRYYEALLAGLAFAAEEALTRPAEPRPLYFPADFTEGRGPDDLVHSDLYGGLTSVDHPDVVVAPGTPLRPLRPRLYQLVSLKGALQQVLLMSYDAKALELDAVRQAGLIRSRGTPIVWSYVATEEGALVGYPGVGEYPDDYDPRRRPWYELARAERRPVWGAIDIDESGLGLLLTATMGVRDDVGTFLGVAAVDVRFEYVVDELMEPKELPYGVQAWLVDQGGKVVVDSKLEDVAGALEAWSPAPLPYPEVVTAMAGEDNHVVADIDGVEHLFAWTELDAMDFTYVVAARASDVFGP